ncbi:hypothetical protein M1446_05010 [Candidatus Dependentiae bacterium]|nr:hypothetical protein [Candidatus Dependentiae bacterium]
MFKLKHGLFALVLMVSNAIAFNDVFYAAIPNEKKLREYIVFQTDQSFKSISEMSRFLSELVSVYGTLKFEEKENAVQAFLDFFKECAKLNEKYAELAQLAPKFMSILSELKTQERAIYKKYDDVFDKIDCEDESNFKLQRFNQTLDFYELYFSSINNFVKCVNGLNATNKSQIIGYFTEFGELFKSKIIDCPEIKKIYEHIISKKISMSDICANDCDYSDTCECR